MNMIDLKMKSLHAVWRAEAFEVMIYLMVAVMMRQCEIMSL